MPYSQTSISPSPLGFSPGLERFWNVLEPPPHGQRVKRDSNERVHDGEKLLVKRAAVGRFGGAYAIRVQIIVTSRGFRRKYRGNLSR